MLIRKLLAEILKNQKEIQKSQQEIKQCLSPSVLKKAQSYDEMQKFLEDVRLAVKTVNTAIGDEGDYEVCVTYALIKEVVRVRSDLKTESSDRFKAINALNMISSKDMERISKELAKAKSLTQKYIK